MAFKQGEMKTSKLYIIINNLNKENYNSEIEENISKMGGVNKVNVYPLSQVMTLEYDRDCVTTEKILSRINSLGYESSKFYEYMDYDYKISSEDLDRKNKFIKFLLSIIITVILFCSSYIYEGGITSVFLSFFVWIYCAGDYHRETIKNLKTNKIDFNLLITISTASSFILNLLSFFSIDYFNNQGIKFYELTLFISIVNLAEYLMSFSNRINEKISLMSRFSPRFATLIKDKSNIRARVEDISVGDKILIRKGEQIPCDCVVEKGESDVDESIFTGEASYKKKKKGDILYSSTINISGDLIVTAQKTGSDTLFMQIAMIAGNIKNFEENRINLLNKNSFYILLYSLIFSSLFAFITFLNNGFYSSLHLFLYSLFILIPSSFFIIYPLSLLISFSRASKTGFVINNSRVFDVIKKINLIIFDNSSFNIPLDNLKNIAEKFRIYNIKPVVAGMENKDKVEKFSNEIGTDDYYFEVMPREKHSIVIKYKMLGYRVMMIGDGLNDTAAILASDLGVSVKRGSDIISTSSDMVLIKPDISLIFNAIELSKKLDIIIKQNIIISVLISFLSGLFVFIHFYRFNQIYYLYFLLSLLSFIAVLLNSIRLYRIPIEPAN